MKKAIFLDRDGVLNQNVLRDGNLFSPRKEHELNLISGVVEAVEIFKFHRYLLIVVTNQPDIARGMVTSDEVARLNMLIAEKTGIKHFYICPHDDLDYCECRKPKPGLIIRASQDHNIDLAKSYMIGDRISDIQAGYSAGCKNSILISQNQNISHKNVSFVTARNLLEIANNFPMYIK